MKNLTLGLGGLAVAVALCLQAETGAQQTGHRPPSAQGSGALRPFDNAQGRPEPVQGRQAQGVPSPSRDAGGRNLLDRYCVTCHNERVKTADLMLDRVDITNPGGNPDVWEKVMRKVRIGTMPPPNMPQLSPDDRTALLTLLETSLDAAWAEKPNPGRTETLRRLNRTEYRNAVRDLLSLDIDANSLLPADESGHGFDNVTVGDLPPTLLDRYISAAQKVSRLAIGSTQTSMQADTIRLPADRTQETHVSGLPLGTRGGASIPYTFAQDGEYEIQVWLARDLSGNVGGLRERTRSHEMVVLVDREQVKSFTIQKLVDDDTTLDKDLRVRVNVTAGPHDIGVTFINDSSSLLEAQRQPLLARFNERRHPRTAPAVDQVSVSGPYAPKGATDTPSRRRIFVCRPAESDKEKEIECAKTILSTLMRRAYRRPVSKAEIEGPLALYREGRTDGDFDAGIGRALSAVLINPEFLFRVEADPAFAKATAGKPREGNVYRITDLELASRLSFFLWSSIPDDELLDAAIRGRLSRPEELEKQTRRMLADRRSLNLATNFAGQWLRLRNLDAFVPSTRLYPEFDDNIREGFRQETELFFDSVVREDRSVLDLIRADYTFLNERLAKHYGIPNVYGSHFRRVTVGPETRRGGLLRHGSVLAVTSYATRTSPIIRGVYVLDNIFGAPPPPPLPNVPALDEGTVSASLPMRERLAAHRKNAVCASCHRTIDPVGFALENFNAVGQWRSYEGEGEPIDASGALPGAGEFSGVAGLEDALLGRPEMFTGALTEKLLTFALGRGVEYYDAPAVRKIVRDTAKDGYRFSSLILGIVKSVPFQMRSAH
jgi:mono/diheme cytochrome c family protein